MTARHSSDRHAGGRRSLRQTLLLVAGCCLLLAAAGIAVTSQWDHIAYALGLTDRGDPYVSERSTTARGTPKTSIYRLVIPRLGINVKIRNGGREKALRLGVWHQSNGASPRTRGNSVISGHRVTRAFVLLDKLQRGDRVVVYWGKRRYVYRVVRVYETGPQDKRLTRCGTRKRLTLYTCVARVEGDRRVVVVAVPV